MTTPLPTRQRGLHRALQRLRRRVEGRGGAWERLARQAGAAQPPPARCAAAALTTGVLGWAWPCSADARTALARHFTRCHTLLQAPSPGWQQRGEQHPQQQQQQQQDPREAIDRGVSLLLLFGAAVDRLASRLQTAVLATGRVTWQLGREGLVGLCAAARRASGTARTSLASRWVRAANGSAVQPRPSAVQPATGASL